MKLDQIKFGLVLAHLYILAAVAAYPAADIADIDDVAVRTSIRGIMN